MNQNRTVIAIDGLAGSGKTTLSRKLAERLGFVHMSTGMLYRAVGYLCVRDGINSEDPTALAAAVKAHSIELRLGQKESSEVWLDGVNIVKKIYSPEVSEATSKSSQYKEVREALVFAQKEAFPGADLVAEGRDMGSVIFTDALVKFFVETAPEVRVARRIEQMHGSLDNYSEHERNSLIKEAEIEVLARDERDSQREIAPAKPAPDAIMIDNSSKTLTEVVQTMYDAVAAAMQKV